MNIPPSATEITFTSARFALCTSGTNATDPHIGLLVYKTSPLSPGPTTQVGLGAVNVGIDG
mgnify:CR=1 FL=1